MTLKKVILNHWEFAFANMYLLHVGRRIQMKVFLFGKCMVAILVVSEFQWREKCFKSISYLI